MLIKPSIDSLLEKVDNKYALVVLTAARARQLRETLLSIEGDIDEDSEDSIFLKEVSVALEEIDAGEMGFSQLDSILEDMKKRQERKALVKEIKEYLSEY